MISFLLVLVLVFDICLLLYVYFSSKKQVRYTDLLNVFKEERLVLEEMRGSFKEEVSHAKKELKALCQRAETIVTESEMIFQQAKSNIDEASKELSSEISSHLSMSLLDVQKRCENLDRLMRQSEFNKNLLLKGIEKAEILTQFFNEKIPYEELIEEIEDKKFVDARTLLSKGVCAEDVARQVNMPLSEVRLLLGIST